MEKKYINQGRSCWCVSVMWTRINVSLCIVVSRSTHQTDTTWCPSSPPPTLSRTPHTTCPRPHAPSWVKSSNTVSLHSTLWFYFKSFVLILKMLLNVEFWLAMFPCGDQASVSQTRFFRGKRNGPNCLSRPTFSQSTSRLFFLFVCF